MASAEPYHEPRMVLWTLLLAAGAAYLVSATYAYVGERMRRRRLTDPQYRRANGFFVLWWTGLAVNIAIGATLYSLAAFGWTSFTAQYGYLLLQRALLVASLVGLLYYMLFLLTGHGRLFPLSLFYGGYLVFLVASVVARRPDGVLVYNWRTDLSYAADNPPLFALVNFFALLVPPIAGSVGLLVVARRTRATTGPRKHFRLVVLAWAIIVWWLVSAVAGQGDAFDVAWLQIVNRVVGVLTALAVLAAYQPGAWLSRWLAARRAHGPPGERGG